MCRQLCSTVGPANPTPDDSIFDWNMLGSGMLVSCVCEAQSCSSLMISCGHAAGSTPSADTSSFTMAYLAYLLACHPAASAAAAREVQQLLKSTGRVTCDGSGDVMLLNAEDVARLPLLTGCVNETMRLAPAGTVLIRTAAQASFVCLWDAPQSPTGLCQQFHFVMSTCRHLPRSLNCE